MWEKLNGGSTSKYRKGVDEGRLAERVGAIGGKVRSKKGGLKRFMRLLRKSAGVFSSERREKIVNS